jgi:hypothetical protein
LHDKYLHYKSRFTALQERRIEMSTINWRHKLTSRKLWVLVAGLTSTTGLIIGLDESTTSSIVAIVGQLGAIAVYIGSEAYIDATRIKQENAPVSPLPSEGVAPQEPEPDSGVFTSTLIADIASMQRLVDKVEIATARENDKHVPKEIEDFILPLGENGFVGLTKQDLTNAINKHTEKRDQELLDSLRSLGPRDDGK